MEKTPLEFLQHRLRKELQAKQKLRVMSILDGDTAAAKRAELSIALRVRKLLCEHKIEVVRYPGLGISIRCRLCKTSYTD